MLRWHLYHRTTRYGFIFQNFYFLDADTGNLCNRRRNADDHIWRQEPGYLKSKLTLQKERAQLFSELFLLIILLSY